VSSRLTVDPLNPDPVSIRSAADAVLAGSVVIFPTDTLYGLAADPSDARAVQRIFAAKGRSEGKALPLVAADIEQVERFLGALTPQGKRLAQRLWPGALTLVVAAPAHLPDEVTAGSGTVGIRVPDHAVARALCRACERPLTATSANLSGEPPTSDPDVAAQLLGPHIEVLLDAGRTRGGPPSTIVDLTAGTPRLVRSGAVDWDTIAACLAGP
jgi:L-threonylcarbamoyladenylate synthase